MTARWIPDDAELDAVARSIDSFEPSRERVEENRTATLASAATRVQQSRSSRAPWIAGGVALAAAAAAAIWVGSRSTAQEPSRVALPIPKQIITPIGVARFERVTDWPDFVVRLDDGKIAVQVATLDHAGDRFRVTTVDAEVETRGARFEMGADLHQLSSVAVQEGRVEIRRVDQQVVILSAGETWAPVKTATRDDIMAPAPPSPPHTEQVPPAPARKIEHVPIVGSRPQHDLSGTQFTSPETTARVPQPSVETPVAPRPGEAEFRAGMAALRANDPAGATKSFAAACKIARHEALGEDACFWAAAAAKRAGDIASARGALESFLQAFPQSVRAPEAAALLGWIVYDGGDLDGAEKLFHQAEHDRVPQVRESAQRGLTAIDRRRHAK